MCKLFFERRQKSLLKTLDKSPIVEKTFGYLVIHKWYSLMSCQEQKYMFYNTLLQQHVCGLILKKNFRVYLTSSI